MDHDDYTPEPVTYRIEWDEGEAVDLPDTVDVDENADWDRVCEGLSEEYGVSIKGFTRVEPARPNRPVAVTREDFAPICPNCRGRGYVESEESGSRCTECMGTGTVNDNEEAPF